MSRVFGATRVAMMAVAAKGKGKAAGAAAAGGGAAALSEKPRSTGIFKVIPISPAMRWELHPTMSSSKNIFRSQVCIAIITGSDQSFQTNPRDVIRGGYRAGPARFFRAQDGPSGLKPKPVPDP
ncbi:hypothetical protein EJ110_NYTH17771 [Nymphaea thermarum]|nr:hypothetical protein EJ110_NYTH17771 [Nymphaea thermarum]